MVFSTELVGHLSHIEKTWSQCICKLYDQSWGLRIHFPLKFSWPSPGPVDIISGLSVGSGASLVAQMVKNPPAMQETWFHPWVGKISWRRERLPTPVFWPGEFHGLYRPWAAKSQTWLGNFHFQAASQAPFSPMAYNHAQISYHVFLLHFNTIYL